MSTACPPMTIRYRVPLSDEFNERRFSTSASRRLRHIRRPAPGRSGRRLPVRNPGAADRHPVPGRSPAAGNPSSSSTAATSSVLSGCGAALFPESFIVAAASRTARPIPCTVMPGKRSRASKFLPRISSRSRLISSGQNAAGFRIATQALVQGFHEVRILGQLGHHLRHGQPGRLVRHSGARHPSMPARKRVMKETACRRLAIIAPCLQ